MYWMLDWFHHPPARLAWIWKKHDEAIYIYILCCYFGRLPRLFRPFRLSSLRKSDAFIVGFWFGFLGNTFPPKPRHWWDDSLMTFLSKGPKYWIYLDKIANSIICFFEKTPTRKLVSQSPSDEGSGSQIELWKWQASAVPLFACSSAWYLLPWKKRYCTSWKRLRWDQARSNTRKYTLHVLTCIPKSPSMSGTRTSAADLIT